MKRGKSTVTHHYRVERDGEAEFEKIPVDGSQRMDDAYMDSIEPFDYDQLTEFHPSYLAGYTAEKYDVDAKNSRSRAVNRMETTVEKLFRKTVRGYNTVKVIFSDINVTKGTMSYTLLPVWTVSTKYNEDDYLFMMNGQTGKMVGRLPVDEGKSWICRGILTIGLLAALTPILYYLNMKEWLGPAITFAIAICLSVVGIGWPKALALDVLPTPVVVLMSIVLSVVGAVWIVHLWIRNMDTARERTEASNYLVPGSFIWRGHDERIY
ncbi:hypothetical protein R80B4_00388 [Fibrobacteres bacterium R8-0-B4]